MMRQYLYYRGPIRNDDLQHRIVKPSLQEADDEVRRRGDDPDSLGLRIQQIQKKEGKE